MDETNKNDGLQNGISGADATENNGMVIELNQCRTRLVKAEEQIKYLCADFENFRRNTEKERAIWAQSAQTQVFTDLLIIVDNFERALAELARASLSDGERIRFQGFELIHKEVVSLLSRYGVVEVPVNIPFDPEKHEALVQIDAPDKASGQIVDVFQKGYAFKDAILRPAKVSVAK
jgi:molecular chaperone GrpE